MTTLNNSKMQTDVRMYLNSALPKRAVLCAVFIDTHMCGTIHISEGT